jgi:restriction endonuclease related protein
MSELIDILENKLLQDEPGLLEVLLSDHTTRRNIFWATDSYVNYDQGYEWHDNITVEAITGRHGNTIMPRALKSRNEQLRRSRQMAEVFTPSWVVKKMNDVIDKEWTGLHEEQNEDQNAWQSYVLATRLEITCGEAPFLTSRYDTVSGDPIPIKERIGVIDRKLRKVNDNCPDGEWARWALLALGSVYGYEWQGDNLLLAREALLATFDEYHEQRFGTKADKAILLKAAEIISWNVWQMDGFIAESIQRYSQAKERQGKGAEEQMIDNVSSHLTSVLLSAADKGAEEAQEDKLTKRNQGMASVRIKKAVNEQIGTHCHQASIDKKKIDRQCELDCQGKTTQQQKDIKNKAEADKKAIDDNLANTIQDKVKDLLDKGSEIIADTYEQQRIDKKKGNTDELIRDYLRGFSRTIPSFLMGYGNEETTLQNFDSHVPDEVFLEVTSITKEQFHLLRDGGDYVNEETARAEHSPGHLFDEVVFNDSVREFMTLHKQLANYFDPEVEEDIFNYIPPQKTNQIFTPKWVVKQMVDLLEQENPGCFDDPSKTFADLYMKSGQYITEIVKRLYNSEGLRKAYPDSEVRLRHIFKYQVYGLAPTECIYRIALRCILGFDNTIHIAAEEHHLRMADTLPAAKNGTMEEFLDNIFKG